MSRILAASAFAALLAAFPSIAANPTQDKIVVEARKVVDLSDGGSIIIDKDGKTYHADANGKRVRMKDGVVMVGKDGAKYLHKNDVIWKAVTDKGTLAPNR